MLKWLHGAAGEGSRHIHVIQRAESEQGPGSSGMVPSRSSENGERSYRVGLGLDLAGTIALLCEVGHALAKADAKSDVRLKTDTARMVEGAEKHEARSADFLGIHGAGQKPAPERS